MSVTSRTSPPSPERGKLDSIFFADSPVLFGDVGRRPAGKLEPTVLLTALAGATERSA
jgi:alkanesulfonate monooxygenase SsuD/methylene tetrahydromethanopterin reductase-like flavin-dependent oxidoreductase (luciferase family)